VETHLNVPRVLMLTGRRLLSAPLINNPAEPSSTQPEPSSSAAVVSSTVEATLSDFPSPASSAAEALEMESITFGQDATDLLHENSSAAGHS